MLRHEFGVESLIADIRWIVTPWCLRTLHRLSHFQALYEQETAIHVSWRPWRWRCVTPKGHWRRCTGLCSMSAPGLGSQIWNPSASALAFTRAYSSHSAELGAMSGCVLLQLLMWLPCMRTLPLVLRLSAAVLAHFAPLWAVSIACSSWTLYSYTSLGQPAPSIFLCVSVLTSQALSVSTSTCSFPWLRIANQFCLWPGSSLEHTRADTS